MTNPIAERSEQATSLVESDDTGIMSIISRAAADPGTDVAKLERLMDLYDRVKATEAEGKFNTAMKVAQKSMASISKDAVNPQTKSKYASYGQLDAALRPIYTANGFSISFDTEDGAPPEYVRVVAYVAHEAGMTRKHHIDMPADGKGAKGGDVMTKTHAVGAGVSYGRRYLQLMIFNIATNDKDGNAPDETRITDQQVADLTKLIDDTETDIEKFCGAYQIDALVDLPPKAFEAAKNVLLQKALRKAQAK